MRSSLLLAALMGSAMAGVVDKRQGTDLDYVDAVAAGLQDGAPIGGGSDPPDFDADEAAASAAPVTSDPAPSATSSPSRLKARAQCAPQPTGKGPATSPDTAPAFLANSVYANIANSAYAPSGYTKTYGPINNATNSKTYLGYYTLDTFSPTLCQQKCDTADSCYGFNIYFERDPTISACDSNLDPPSTVNIKCALYGSTIGADSAVNQGSWRNKFRVAIAGSMGYAKNAGPPSIAGFDGPVELGGAIDAPSGTNTYIGYKMQPGGGFNPAYCAKTCLDTTAYNQRHPRSDGTYDTCYFFNAYVVTKDGSDQGTYCGLYTQTWGKKYGTNYGGQIRKGHLYTNSQSYGYTLSQRK